VAQANNKELIMDIVSKYADTIKREMKVDRVILYGSYSKGNQREDSDIDVAVVSPDFSGDTLEDQLKLMKYRRNVDMRIEPMPFLPEDFSESNPFVKEIVQTGTVINLGNQ
jgi:predicted nucleotidyltransferase